MLKEFAEYLQKMKENKTYEIGGRTYSDNPLVEIEAPVDRPEELEINGLDSCVALIQREIGKIRSLPVYVRVVSPRLVEVFTEWDERFERDRLYRVSCDAPQFLPGWMDYESAIIVLRSGFVENEGLEYLLDLLERHYSGKEKTHRKLYTVLSFLIWYQVYFPEKCGAQPFVPPEPPKR